MKVLSFLRDGIPLLAILGAVVLGFVEPRTLGGASLSVLGGAIGGYYGNLKPQDRDGDGVPDVQDVVNVKK